MKIILFILIAPLLCILIPYGVYKGWVLLQPFAYNHPYILLYISLVAVFIAGYAFLKVLSLYDIDYNDRPDEND